MTESSSKFDLEQNIAAAWPVACWRDAHVLLGVSGGADSVALLRAMLAIRVNSDGRGKLYVAHLNHGYRQNTADADENWLRSLCARHHLELEVGRESIAAIADERGDGWEEAARSIRYTFLQRAAERIGARYVVTAHTLNDQVETVIHRILRGTGIEGLAGISVARPLTSAIALVRPMLNVTRDDVLQYLAVLGQDYCTDETNLNTRWTRNRLRHDLIPSLREYYNPQVCLAISRLAAQAGDAQRVISKLATDLHELCVRVHSDLITIDCSSLVNQPAIVVGEVFKLVWRQAGWGEQSMGSDQWQALIQMATTNVSRILNLPGSRRATREGQTLVLEVLAGQSDLP